ncbi:pilus assembly protein PilP [Caviibacterium pharyngocola]|uniref:Pilus assembly protein PilP n=1 Tax=Caviibacterium pharyngocola TaxID=28159 RepID=A0A2M8RVP7_9PAST|nr:pilus assembly protein PilP [Caviibacterium pharyngocola]PJG82959.1 hypothetical protein CVP04_06245 [Caviibacterium pharyngocola]
MISNAKPLVMLFIGTVLSTSYAADPFDKTQRQIAPAVQVAAQQENAPNNVAADCHSSAPALAPDTPFAQLNIVGAITEKDNTRILLMDPQQSLIIANQGDLVGQEKIKIDRITLNNLSIIRWTQDTTCRHFESVTIKF